MLLPDVLTLPLLLAGLGATAWLDPDSLPIMPSPPPWATAALFAIAQATAGCAAATAWASATPSCSVPSARGWA